MITCLSNQCFSCSEKKFWLRLVFNFEDLQFCSLTQYDLFFFQQVQEESSKGSLQSHRPGCVPVSDWLLTDHLWGSSPDRNYRSRGEILYNIKLVTKFRKFVNHLRSPSHRPNLIGKICDFSC